MTDIKAFKKQTILASGLTVAEAEAQKITDKIYADAFKKDIPMLYRDARAKTPTQFICANPYGSEDLASYDLNTDDYTLLRALSPQEKVLVICDPSVKFVHAKGQNLRTSKSNVNNKLK